MAFIITIILRAVSLSAVSSAYFAQIPDVNTRAHQIRGCRRCRGAVGRMICGQDGRSRRPLRVQVLQDEEMAVALANVLRSPCPVSAMAEYLTMKRCLCRSASVRVE